MAYYMTINSRFVLSCYVLTYNEIHVFVDNVSKYFHFLHISEEGLFLALDLGGTNFRVLLLELRGGELIKEDVKQYHIR